MRRRRRFVFERAYWRIAPCIASATSSAIPTTTAAASRIASGATSTTVSTAANRARVA